MANTLLKKSEKGISFYFINFEKLNAGELEAEKRHLNIRLTGRVQGVGFRYSAQHIARQFGVTGFVRNIPDGSVYIEAEGNEIQLADFLSWCREGPPRSKIMQVNTTEGSLRNYSEFEIR